MTVKIGDYVTAQMLGADESRQGEFIKDNGDGSIVVQGRRGKYICFAEGAVKVVNPMKGSRKTFDEALKIYFDTKDAKSSSPDLAFFMSGLCDSLETLRPSINWVRENNGTWKSNKFMIFFSGKDYELIRCGDIRAVGTYATLNRAKFVAEIITQVPEFEHKAKYKIGQRVVITSDVGKGESGSVFSDVFSDENGAPCYWVTVTSPIHQDLAIAEESLRPYLENGYE